MLAGRGNLKIVLTDRHVLTCTLRQRQVVQPQMGIMLQHLTVPLRLWRGCIRKHSPQPVISTNFGRLAQRPSKRPLQNFELSYQTP